MDNRVLRALKSRTKSLCFDKCSLRELPSALGRLSFLQSLSAKNNSLQTLPQETSRLVELKYLNLGCNEFEDIPECLLSLATLQTLHLFNNRLTSLPNTFSRSLYNLVSLNLNNNSLHRLPADLHCLTHLQILSASNNELLQLPVELCSLLHLTELHLDGNKLTHLPREVGQLSRLRKLMLQKNSLTNITHGVGECSSLSVLDVSCNDLELFPLELSQLKLREFYYDNNPLLPHILVPAEQETEVLPLRELSSRLIVKELRSNNTLLAVMVSYYPGVEQCLSQAGTCCVCGEPFINSWLECVQFKKPKLLLKLENRTRGMIPLKASLCSYKCFNSQDHEFYGIAAPVT